MSGSNAHISDTMIRRLETELREKEAFANGVIERAQASGRDLSEDDKKLLVETRGRMEEIKDQIENLESLTKVSVEVRNRAVQADRAISTARGNLANGPVEYRSAGEYTLDLYRAAMGSREAKDRMEYFLRSGPVTADHTVVGDNEGIIPDPVIQPVINFIDSGRPLVAALGVRPLPSYSWHRPHVLQHTTVGEQAAEKDELSNQRLKVERLDVTAKTYGGYANVSRQVVDFSNPAGLDLVVQDLAGQYAIETEAAAADAIAATNTAAVDYDSTDVATVTSAIWDAIATIWSVTRGQGTPILVVSPNALKGFGSLFNPVNPQNAQSTGFSAIDFAQGIMGNISGIRTIMSAGLSGTESFLLSTAVVEVYEQRVGTLQVTEPSVLGVQVAYAGHFATLVIDDAAIVPLNDTGLSG